MTAGKLVLEMKQLRKDGIRSLSVSGSIPRFTRSRKYPERDILRQRVNAGVKAARRRGGAGCRPKLLDEADIKNAQALSRKRSSR
jgi:hypothetical protein